MSRPLSLRDALALSAIVECAVKNIYVARLIPDGENAAGLVVEGTSRSIGDLNANFAADDDDIRDCHLRVTTISGFEAFWLVSTLMEEYHQGTFVVHYQPSRTR